MLPTAGRINRPTVISPFAGLYAFGEWLQQGADKDQFLEQYDPSSRRLPVSLPGVTAVPSDVMNSGWKSFGTSRMRSSCTKNTFTARHHLGRAG